MITYEFLMPANVTEEDASDAERLIAQLTASPVPVTCALLAAAAGRSLILAARDEAGRIQGMATLCVVHKLTGSVGVIEDVVVDTSLHGRHVGEALMLGLMKRAVEMGCIQRLELTSKPERIAANRLYQKLGFVIRQTNAYARDLCISSR